MGNFTNIVLVGSLLILIYYRTILRKSNDDWGASTDTRFVEEPSVSTDPRFQKNAAITGSYSP